MDLPPNYSEKFRRRVSKKSGAPRSEREELIEHFRTKLNEEQQRDNRPLYTHAHLAKRLHAITNSGLYSLYHECSAEGVRSFGAMLTHKLKTKST